MNNLEELKQELKKLENKINELESKENNNYKRKSLEEYFYLDECGDVVLEDDYDNNLNNHHYSIGNYFETKEQAENYKERLLIEQELKDIAMELNKGEELYWEVDSRYKYYLCYDFSEDIIMNDNYSIFVRRQGTIYCLNENFKDIAIERIGKERLTKYLKGELD